MKEPGLVWKPLTVAAAMLAGVAIAHAQAAPATAPEQTPAVVTAAVVPAAQGGTVRGSVVAGVAGKPGGIALPGVALTATNTITGRKYATATDVDGTYAMTIPKNGRYVIRAELAGFAAATQEVIFNGADTTAKLSNFGMELASRAASEEARQTATAAATGIGARAGTLNLNLSAGSLDASDASAGATNAGAQMPTLSGLGDSGGSATDSVAISGQTGQTNALGGISEDDIRQRIDDAVAQGRANGMIPQGGDPTSAIVGMIGGLMGGGGGSFGGGGGGAGGRGGRGGGGGSFRNFNPAQPHGSIFYQGGNSALNSAPWSPTLLPLTNPAAYSNRFGVSLAGSPYLPGLTKPNTKQFAFINLTGQKNLNAFLPNPVRVPTALERTGDFSQSTQGVGVNATPVTLYDPKLGTPIAGNNLANSSQGISPQALALLNYYSAPNIPLNAQGYNYQTISNAGSNNIAINSRYQRQLGTATATPFGNFGGGGGGGGRRGGGNNATANTKPTLHQNINLSYNYSHSASDSRKIFLPLGGATESDGNAVTAGYVISFGRLSNNASVTWNRSNAKTRNYFTDSANNPTATANIVVPNNTGGFADPRFYNGLPSISLSNFAGLSNTTPSNTINQTISFSDFVSYRHKKHNLRFGFDIRRVHADSIGGNNPLGSFTFTGYATASPADQAAGKAGTTSGSAFADFLLGLPQSTAIQAGLYKTYLRENVYDGYVTDDFRVISNVTINYGLRYEYFGPYSEKNNRLVNVDHNAGFTAFDTVMPNSTGMFQGQYNSSVVNPDRSMFAPRVGLAWRPKSKYAKDTVVRGGYGINYNTGQYAQFARSLSHQQPFANTQTNTLTSGCTTTTPTTTANMTLANGFGCSSTSQTVRNNYAVDKNYRLGLVQVYNLNIQRTLPYQIVANIGYSGSKGSNLDVVGSPNGTPSGNLYPTVALFDYEESIASSHSNQLVVSLQKRQQKGIALGATYTYSHTIDNASGVGGAAGTPVQNFYRIDLENANASFDQRHNLTGNWVLELPFGPNRAYFNKGGLWSHLLDNFSLSGTFTFATGTYFTPQYAGNQAAASSGNVYTQRPNRDYTRSTVGNGRLRSYFNTAAFSAPAAGQYGTASPNSILGPGTVSTNASLSRTVPLGDTRSFEARVTASNVFNTVQYNSIDTTVNSATYGQVLSAASMRAIQVQARYRF